MNKMVLAALLIYSLASCQTKNTATLRIDKTEIDLGHIKTETSRPFQVCVSNPGDKDISILGVSESCSCVSDSLKLPVVLTPHQSMCIQFHYRSKKDKGSVHESIFISTNTDSLLHKIVVKGVVG
jgi:hypothetical protein